MLTNEEKEKIFADVFFLNFIFDDKDCIEDDKKHKQLIKNLIDIIDREFLFFESINKQKDYWDYKRYQRTVAELNEMCEVGSSIVYQRLGYEQFDKRRNHSFNFFDDIMAVPEVSEQLKIQRCLKIIKLFISEIDYYDGVMAAGKHQKEALRRFLVEDFQEALEHYWICQKHKKNSPLDL